MALTSVRSRIKSSLKHTWDKSLLLSAGLTPAGSAIAQRAFRDVVVVGVVCSLCGFVERQAHAAQQIGLSEFNRPG